MRQPRHSTKKGNIDPLGPRGEFGVGERRATPGDLERSRRGAIVFHSVADIVGVLGVNVPVSPVAVMQRVICEQLADAGLGLVVKCGVGGTHVGEVGTSTVGRDDRPIPTPPRAFLGSRVGTAPDSPG